ncbi:MAG: reprolysin-like metallopeptidase, partial [Bacteroidota bacterium]
LLLLWLIVSSASIGTKASNNPWTPTLESQIAHKDQLERQIIPKVYQTVALNMSTLQDILSEAPLRFSTEAQQQNVLLTLPMPDGSFSSFQIVEAPVMQAGLAAKYPQIRSFAGKGIDQAGAYLRFSISPHGFHGMIMTGHGGDVFIDPYSKGNQQHYIVYRKKDYQRTTDTPFICGVEGKEITKEEVTASHQNAPLPLTLNPTAGDCQLRIYRLALACVGEYAVFHGGTVPSALAAMAVTMTRINGIYERDFGVTMVIVDNNDQLVFLNPSSDPYSNSSGDLGANQNTCDAIIGSANYDVGHLLTTSGGGIATLNAPCNNGQKARGLSGQGAPVGDPYDVDYVAHELGHQFGANHTQNNPCNRNGSTAMEPGSASTIMGYAGICNPNVQSNSDDHFHAISIQEIAAFITNGSGNTCPTTIDTDNNQPVVDAGQDYVLPISTPFSLTAVANDIDGDSLTYCWEQMDNQTAPMPPQSTSTVGPAFRSNSPANSPTRYFPNLTDLLNNVDPEWEELPGVSRDMSFRCTVRDNYLGGGCTAEDDVDLVFTAEAGPFLVTNPNTNVTWTVGDFANVTWDVANTDVAPVNCSEVNILLSTDGGQTYPITLATNVPNNGSYLAEVPNQIGTTNRVIVVCADNVFFDISNTNFEIVDSPNPGIAINVSPEMIETCPSLDAVTFTVQINSLGGFSGAVNLNVNGLSPMADLSYDPASQVNAPATVNITLNNPEILQEGMNDITVNASGGMVSNDANLQINLLPESPEASQLSGPANLTQGVLLGTALSWTTTDYTDQYLVEIATNPSFTASSIVASATVTTNSYSPQNLNSYTVYYWRVSGSNICGSSVASDFFSFQTENPSCQTFASEDVPVIISQNTQDIYNSSLQIPDSYTILDLNLSLEVSHSWVGDLYASIESPNGQTFDLFDQPGVPGSNFGCDESNLLITFDDEAENSANDLENSCSGGNYAIEGNFQPIDAFSALNGQDAQGEWILTIGDNFDQDGGALEAWSLEICFASDPVTEVSLSNQILALPKGTSATIENGLLSASSTNLSASDHQYLLTALPENGSLMLNGTLLNLGATFTQDDIDNNLLSYTHDNSETSNDAFLFDIINSAGFWSNNNTFSILIFDEALSASAVVTEIPSCFDANDATVTVSAFGGTPPYTYSINGADFQTSNIFTGLNAGDYTFTVQDAENNIVATNSIGIDNPPALEIAVSAIGNTINIDAIGGTGDYAYSIDGVNFQSDPLFANLPNGDYTVLVIDDNGCTTSEVITIAINTLAIEITIVEDLTCFGASDASISAMANGGTPPYEYSIDGQNFQMSPLFEGLPAGSYEITVLDSEDFTLNSTPIVIDNPPMLTITTTVDGNQLTINGSGGTGAYTYSIDGINFQSSNVFSDLDNGTYTVYIQDINMCIATTEATVEATSTSNLNTDIRIDLYPNPSNGLLTIDLRQNSNRAIQLAIYDMVGQLVFSENLGQVGNRWQDQIDLQNLSSGVYHLSVSNHATVIGKRITIVR